MQQTFSNIVVLVLFLFLSPAAAEELIIVGTGSGPPILKAIGKAFTAQYSDITVQVPRSIGSGGGIKAVGTDKYQLARIARMINDSEKRYSLSYLPVARMPVVFFTNPNVIVKNLTKQQILDIYSGTIFNWKDVGGHDARIKVIKRQEGDSSLSVLRKSFPHFKDITITSLSKTTYSDPDTLDLVEKSPNSIAFCTYADVVKRQLNIFALDNISPTDKDYPYYASFGLVYKDKNRKGSVQKFLDFITSPTASEAIMKNGGVPIKTR